MFKNVDFEGTPAQDFLRKLQGKFVWEQGSKIADVTEKINELLMKVQIYEYAPKYVLSRSFYTDADGAVTSARFVLRPSSVAVLDCDPVRKEWVIIAGESFYDKLLADFSEWVDTWTYNAKLQDNLDELNALFADLTAQAEVDYTVSFGLGDGILDVDGSHTVLGLDPEVVKNLGNLVLFDDQNEIRAESSRKVVIDILKEFSNGYELIRSKSYIFKRDLRIWNRKSFTRLLRNIVARQAKHVRVGVGYVSTPDTFALVERKAITAEQAELYKGDPSVLVETNKTPNAREKKQNLTHILTTFRLAPISKEHGGVLDLSISDVVELSLHDFDDVEEDEVDVVSEDDNEVGEDADVAE